jgi:hypothetical protein
MLAAARQTGALMFWLIYGAFFALMLLSIVRMLNQRGKWAWGLFLGLLGSVAVYVRLFVLPVASSAALQNRPALLATIVIAGTGLYIGALCFAIRRIAPKLKAPGAIS